ncbi:MAG TPA: DUF192 domain-containing protein [Acidimicrobiales bacterium]|nr:DUF192 domain-containing protein [Acidimicrobiales bacterium]
MGAPHLSGPGWLLRDGEVLAAAEVANSYRDRIRGLLGRRGYDGALILPRTRAVHSAGMHFAIDVAFLDRGLRVVDAVVLPPWRCTRPRLRCWGVLEAEAGAFERWNLRPGDQLELRCPT